MMTLRQIASSAIITTDRIWTAVSRLSATTRSDFLNSSAMITVRIMPNTAWNAE